MLNYINDLSIYGLMNKNSYINYDTNHLSFYKTKNKKRVVFFRRYDDVDESVYDQINYMYMDDDPHDNRAVCMEQIVSILDNHMFEDMPGKKYREIRETIHKYKNYITIKPINKDTKDAVIDMIERWRYMENGGMKFGWQEHAGIDKAIIDRYIKYDWRESIIGMSFWIDNLCVGYSMIERFASGIDNDILEYKYLTRKVTNNPGLRNLTEYIDWLTFKQLYRNHKIYHPESNKFLVNWGCSTGGVHWYKTHKWPVYSTEKKWFLTIKNSAK
ncbi:MAG: hypothetical protein J6D03_00380 [Clostridia bacterium]|nr:hypothetical protein [Clostridia bacterium]